MIRQIHLHGKVAEQTGVDSLRLDVNSPYELFRALSSQVPGFRQSLSEFSEAVIIMGDGENFESLTPETIVFPLSDKAKEIHMVTAPEGSGIEFGVVASFLASYGVTSTVVVAIAYVAVNLAISFALGAIAQALAPSPTTTDGSGKPDERPSFLYNGPINVIEQGYPVPLVYGTHMVGSVVVSVGVEVEEIPYETDKENPPANGGGSSQPAEPPAESYQWSSSGGY